MMSSVRGQLDVLASQPAVRDALREAARSSPALVEEALRIQKIPAPTFGEAQRAAYVLDYFRQRQLNDVACDDVHCVYARIPGANP